MLASVAVKAGLRFSTNVFAASLWSAVSPARERWIASASKQASSDMCSALLMLVFPPSGMRCFMRK